MTRSVSRPTMEQQPEMNSLASCSRSATGRRRLAILIGQTDGLIRFVPCACGGQSRCAHLLPLREPRRGLHARIAETLETGFAEIADAQPELLAHHCTEAGLIEKASLLCDQAQPLPMQSRRSKTHAKSAKRTVLCLRWPLGLGLEFSVECM
jgi:hypothetical protein